MPSPQDSDGDGQQDVVASHIMVQSLNARTVPPQKDVVGARQACQSTEGSVDIADNAWSVQSQDGVVIQSAAGHSVVQGDSHSVAHLHENGMANVTSEQLHEQHSAEDTIGGGNEDSTSTLMSEDGGAQTESSIADWDGTPQQAVATGSLVDKPLGRVVAVVGSGVDGKCHSASDGRIGSLGNNSVMASSHPDEESQQTSFVEQTSISESHNVLSCNALMSASWDSDGDGTAETFIQFDEVGSSNSSQS